MIDAGETLNLFVIQAWQGIFNSCERNLDGVDTVLYGELEVLPMLDLASLTSPTLSI